MFLNTVCFKFYIDLYLHIRYIYRVNHSSDLLKINVSGLIILSIMVGQTAHTCQSYDIIAYNTADLHVLWCVYNHSHCTSSLLL